MGQQASSRLGSKIHAPRMGGWSASPQEGLVERQDGYLQWLDQDGLEELLQGSSRLLYF
jgi:hypothetical protein